MSYSQPGYQPHQAYFGYQPHQASFFGYPQQPHQASFEYPLRPYQPQPSLGFDEISNIPPVRNSGLLFSPFIALNISLYVIIRIYCI